MNKFDEWFYEVELYGTRAERLWAELNHDGEKYRVVKEWLKASYDEGTNQLCTEIDPPSRREYKNICGNE